MSDGVEVPVAGHTSPSTVVMPKLGTNVMFWFSFPRFTPRETEDERELGAELQTTDAVVTTPGDVCARGACGVKTLLFADELLADGERGT